MIPAFDDRDQVILDHRQALLLARDPHVPQAGDFVVYPNGSHTRIGEMFLDVFQTASGGRFYRGEGYLSFSDGLNFPQPQATLTPMEELHPGWAWFFHHDYHQGDNSVGCVVQCRVWRCSEQPVRWA